MRDFIHIKLLFNISGVALRDLYVRVTGYGGAFNDAFKICAIPECIDYIELSNTIDGAYTFVAGDSIQSSSDILTG